MTESNRTLIENFYTSFNTSRTDLSSRIDEFKAESNKSSAVLDQISLEIAKLRKELVHATVFLPAYDQRQYELQVKCFEQSLEHLRVSAAPKPKFTFKRKQAASPSSSQAAVEVKKPSASNNSSSAAAAAIASNVRALSGHSKAHLTQLSLPSISSESGSELTISDIDHCVIDMIPRSSSSPRSHEGANLITALHVKNVKNSILLMPIMSGSAILHDVKNTVLVIGCHQFRMHSSSHVDVYLSIPSHPIIEHCSDIRFAGYPSYLLEDRNVTEGVSKHLSVQDFSHIRATPSPNWRPLPENAVIAQDLWPRAPLQEEAEAVISHLLPSTSH